MVTNLNQHFSYIWWWTLFIWSWLQFVKLGFLLFYWIYLECFRSFSWWEFSISQPPSDKARVVCLGEDGAVWGEWPLKFVWGLGRVLLFPGWMPSMQYGSLKPWKNIHIYDFSFHAYFHYSDDKQLQHEKCYFFQIDA